MSNFQFCCRCHKTTNILIKPYRSRGRFPYVNGALCSKCCAMFEKAMNKKGIKPPFEKADFMDWLQKNKVKEK